MCSHVTDEESENVGLNVLANIDGAEEVAAKMCKEAQCSELRGAHVLVGLLGHLLLLLFSVVCILSVS